MKELYFTEIDGKEYGITYFPDLLLLIPAEDERLLLEDQVWVNKEDGDFARILSIFQELQSRGEGSGLSIAFKDDPLVSNMYVNYIALRQHSVIVQQQVVGISYVRGERVFKVSPPSGLLRLFSYLESFLHNEMSHGLCYTIEQGADLEAQGDTIRFLFKEESNISADLDRVMARYVYNKIKQLAMMEGVQ